MHILTLNLDSNPNIGLYGYCTDEYCLLGKRVPEEIAKKIESVLQVPVYQITIAHTSLIGVLCTGNKNCLLLPHLIEKEELAAIKKLKIPFKVIETKLTALGNNILCNDDGCLVNPDFSADTKKIIRTALDVPLHPGTIADVEVVGSCAVITKKGSIVHPYVSKETLTELKQLLKIKPVQATVNFGSPYLRSGIIANSKGFVMGDQ